MLNAFLRIRMKVEETRRGMLIAMLLIQYDSMRGSEAAISSLLIKQYLRWLPGRAWKQQVRLLILPWRWTISSCTVLIDCELVYKIFESARNFSLNLLFWITTYQFILICLNLHDAHFKTMSLREFEIQWKHLKTRWRSLQISPMEIRSISRC